MQKSQQWSFEHLQKQVDHMTENMAELGSKNAKTEDKMQSSLH